MSSTDIRETLARAIHDQAARLRAGSLQQLEDPTFLAKQREIHAGFVEASIAAEVFPQKLAALEDSPLTTLERNAAARESAAAEARARRAAMPPEAWNDLVDDRIRQEVEVRTHAAAVAAVNDAMRTTLEARGAARTEEVFGNAVATSHPIDPVSGRPVDLSTGKPLGGPRPHPRERSPETP